MVQVDQQMTLKNAEKVHLTQRILEDRSLLTVVSVTTRNTHINWEKESCQFLKWKINQLNNLPRNRVPNMHNFNP